MTAAAPADAPDIQLISQSFITIGQQIARIPAISPPNQAIQAQLKQQTRLLQRLNAKIDKLEAHAQLQPIRTHNVQASSASGAPLRYPPAAELPEDAPVTAKELLDMNETMARALAASLNLPALPQHVGLKERKQQIIDFLGCGIDA